MMQADSGFNLIQELKPKRVGTEAPSSPDPTEDLACLERTPRFHARFKSVTPG
jgi:hypothetical protein